MEDKLELKIDDLTDYNDDTIMKTRIKHSEGTDLHGAWFEGRETISLGAKQSIQLFIVFISWKKNMNILQFVIP